MYIYIHVWKSESTELAQDRALLESESESESDSESESESELEWLWLWNLRILLHSTTRQGN